MTVFPLQMMLRQVLDFEFIFHSFLSLVTIAENRLGFSEPTVHAISSFESTSTQAGPALQLIDVGISFLDGRSIVSSISFDIASGEVVAICGRTGAGKSMLAAALFGLVPISSGNLIIDGVDVKTADLPLPNSLLLPQKTILLSGTIRSNLRLPQNIQEDDIWQTMQVLSSELFEKISSNPEGLDWPVSSRTSEFSQSEIQLLAILRVLLLKPRLLILDEATSGLSSSLELHIFHILTSLLNHTTMVWITHRYEW